MNTQLKILQDIMSNFIKNNDEIKLSDVIAIKKDIENKEEKFFLISKNKYELILKKIDSIEKEQKEMQKIMVDLIKSINKTYT